MPTSAPVFDSGIDLSRATRQDLQRWEPQLRAAFKRLHGRRVVRPVDIILLAEAAGLPIRVARWVTENAGWTTKVTVEPPDEQPVLTPDEVERDYVTVDVAASLTGVSRSKVYAALRDPASQIRVISQHGTRFVRIEDLTKLRLLRPNPAARRGPHRA